VDDARTRQTLLWKIRDSGDRRSWREFVEIYTPLLYNYFRARGLQEADAADLGQEVMRSVAGAIARFDYDPDKGTFRSWLYTIARNKLNTFFKKNAKHKQGSGRTTVLRLVEQTIDERQDPDAMWELEHRKRMVAWACEKIRDEFQPKTWEAFERVAVGREDAAKVASDLGLKVGSVYVAKSRVTSKLKETIESVAGEWPDLR
jgi:RNA polymerase sigma factor (sigma-70 family)